MNENRNQKPISILKKEFIENLTDVINNSGVPMILVEYIVKDLLNEIHLMNTKQLQLDMKNSSRDNKDKK